jgi:NAD(P)-dependent dehydrogenase (short-subunit alcohol dehydrogenase family)
VRCNAIRPLALGRSTAEYNEATAKWSVLMAETMRPRGGQASQFAAATPDTHPPAKIAPVVVWLCSDAARDVNGRTFHVTGDLVARFADSHYEQQAVRDGGWTLDALDQRAPTELVEGLTNDFLLEDHPELQEWTP